MSHIVLKAACVRSSTGTGSWSSLRGTVAPPRALSSGSGTAGRRRTRSVHPAFIGSKRSVLMVFHAFFIGFHSCSWFFISFHWFSWIFMGFHGFS